MKKFLTKNILLLSFISFFNDLSSEIIYPILPLYLSSIGLSYALIGSIEGFAELVSSVSKVFFGFYSDKIGKRAIFIKIGYAVSAFSKPIMGLTQQFPLILLARVSDRFSKGIRTAPRDAILIAESSEENRAKVFSFHRSMDNLGATFAPLVAIVFLLASNNDYQTLFLYTAIPGIIVVLLAFLVKSKRLDSGDVQLEKKKRISFKAFLKMSSGNYKKLLVGLVLIAFINSTDFFFLLRAKELLNLNNSYNITLPVDLIVLLLYVLYNLSYVVVANPIAAISDRLGHKKSLIAAMLFFALVYGLFAYNLTLPLLILTFICWGIFATIYENIGKAWISLYIPKEYKATGIGLLVTLMGIATFAGSTLMGLLIDRFNSSIAFSLTSIASIPIIIYFLWARFKTEPKHSIVD
jgi:MFS family permease